MNSYLNTLNGQAELKDYYGENDDYVNKALRKIRKKRMQTRGVPMDTNEEQDIEDQQP